MVAKYTEESAAKSHSWRTNH